MRRTRETIRKSKMKTMQVQLSDSVPVPSTSYSIKHRCESRARLRPGNRCGDHTMLLALHSGDVGYQKNLVLTGVQVPPAACA